MNIVREWFQRNFSDPQVITLVVVVVGILLIAIFFGEMLAPAIAAVVIAFLLDGPVTWLEKRGVPHMMGASLCFAGFLLLAVFAAVAILPPIAGQFVEFFSLLPTMVVSLQDLLGKLPEQFPEIFDEQQVAEMTAGIRQELVQFGQRAVEFSIGGLSSLVAMIIYLVLVPVMVFFFLKDKRPILDWMKGFLPSHRPLASQVWAEVVSRTGDYARGKVYEIIIVGVSAWVAYSLIDLRFAAFLALLTGLSVVIPYIGAAMVTIPVALVAFIQWGVGADFFIAVGLYLILQAIDGNILAPLLFSEVVKLHPNAIILAILVFGGIWGLWGVFFAIPLASVANAIIRAWPRNGPEGRGETGSAPSSPSRD